MGFNSIIILLSFTILQFSHLIALENDSVREEPVLLCYYGSWASYRTGIAHFDVETIDASLCTHIVYTFMGLKNGVIASLDEYNDYEENYGKGSLKKFANFAQDNNLKSLLAIGGWNEGSIKYSQMAATEARRNAFADSVVAFVQKFNFNGFDLDWEYPTQRGGTSEDKENYSLLLETLSEKLHAEGLMLTVAVGADPDIAIEGYDFQKVAQYADYVSLMTFDYHTASSDNVTGMNSPLHALSGETGENAKLNVEYSVNQWLEGGVPANKLIVGQPLYGRTYLLEDPEQHGLGANIVANGTAGQYTNEPGFLSYYEICMNSEWNIVKSEDEVYVYAYYGYNWVSYDDVATTTAKAQFVKDKGLAGIMFWALESEDFQNVCGEGPNPLLTAVNKVFERL